MDFSNLIDLIRDPLSTILIDCRAITNLIAQEEPFQMEFEKVQRDTETLFTVFNHYLQRHIFADGQVKAQTTQEAAIKQFFFESLIQKTLAFRTTLIALLQTVQSVGRLDISNDTGNRSLYALLKYKLQENMLTVLDATRGLMKASVVTASNSNDSSSNSGVGLSPDINSSTSSNNENSLEYVQSVSTSFLTQMRGIAECCSQVETSSHDFQLMLSSYDFSCDQFLQLIKGQCSFDITDRIATVRSSVDDIRRLSLQIHQWVREGRSSDEHRLRVNYDLEQRVLSLVETVKSVFPLLIKTLNKQASHNPLQTSIEFIDLHKLEELEKQLEQIIEDEEDDDDDEVDDNNELDQQLQESPDKQPQSPDKQRQPIDSNKDIEEKATEGGNASPVKIDLSDKAKSRKSWGIDLPSISLCDNSDDEDEEPMIWSLPISSISSDPFKKNEQSNNSNTGNRRSNSASNSGPASVKVYSSKDYDPKLLQSKNGNPNKGESSLKKSKSWTLKNPFRRSKSRENLHEGASPSLLTRQQQHSSTSLLSTIPESSKKSSNQLLPKSSSSVSSLSASAIVQPTTTTTTTTPSNTNNSNSNNNNNNNNNQQQPPSIILSPPASVNSSPGFSSMKWVSSLPSSKSMSNLLIHTDRKQATMTETSNESSSPRRLDEEETDDIVDELADDLDDMESFDHDYFDTPLGIRGSTQEPSVVLFESTKDFTIEEIGQKSKRYCDPPLIRLDHNERHIEHYSTFFYSKEHFNFISNIPSLGGNVIISVVKHEEPGANKQHRTLIRTKSGVEKILVLSRSTKEKDLLRAIQNYIKPIVNIPASSFKSIKTEKISKHLMDFEKIDITKKYHFFVIFCGDGQNTEREMLSNQKVSREFVEFYKFLGKKFNTKGWSAYNGGLDINSNNDGEHAIYTELQGIEIVFHVSHLIPLERRQEILSRNACVLIYHEGKNTFNPSTFTSPKNKIFFEIKKVRVGDGSSIHYKLGVSSFNQVAPFGPMISDPPIYQKQSVFKQFLITKLINAENSVYSTQHLMQELSKQRQKKLDEIVSNVI